jgi:uncharacterized protein YbjT (DUF2867 family)
MNIFIAGATGYIGRHLVPELLRRGHTVRALARTSSLSKLPDGAQPVIGDALNAKTFAHRIEPSDTFVQLVGVPHPSPAKASQFRTVDLVAIRESLRAASGTSIRHFVYLSVAQPSPVMKAYVAVREEGERLVRDSGLPATFVRPFYVLGPGHWWPYLMLPLFWLFAAPHLHPVRLAEVIRAMADAIEAPPEGVRVVEFGGGRREEEKVVTARWTQHSTEN